MKTRFLLSILLLLFSLTGFSKTWAINNSGTTFTPASITINLGDSVKFSIGSSHNSVEVSQATWEANKNTILPGFSTPYGGGLLLPSQLTAGTHYYVCTPHASMGMKGTIIVQNSTVGNAEIKKKVDIPVYPNPSSGMFHVAISGLQFNKPGSIDIYNVVGKKVYTTSVSYLNFDLDISKSKSGIYFMKIFDGQNYITKKIIKQ